MDFPFWSFLKDRIVFFEIVFPIKTCDFLKEPYNTNRLKFKQLAQNLKIELLSQAYILITFAHPYVY